jgi:hypothetical protein
MVALSVSTSAMMSPVEILSPGFLLQETMRPSSMVGLSWMSCTKSAMVGTWVGSVGYL